MWYCAHAIFYYAHEAQHSYRVHENLYLIEAPDPDSATRQAETFAREHEQLGDDSALEIDGRRVEYRFAGVRKLIESTADMCASTEHAASPAEVSYSVFEVENLHDVQRLAAGEAVPVIYLE